MKASFKPHLLIKQVKKKKRHNTIISTWKNKFTNKIINAVIHFHRFISDPTYIKDVQNN